MKIEIDVVKGKITEFSDNKVLERNINNATFVLEGNIEENNNITKEYIDNSIKNCKYKTYKEHLHSLGWNNKLVILDQNNVNNICEYIKIKDITSSYLIRIVFQKGTKITVDPYYTFGLLVLDRNGKEIPNDTKIRIIKDIPSDDIRILLNIYYSDIKMNNGKSGYIFDKGFECNANWHLIITSPQQLDVPKENVMFRLMLDHWTKE